MIHGLSDGHWSMSDAILAMADLVGPSELVVCTWTAAQADIRRAHALLDRGLFRSVRFIVDRSFMTRQAEYCRLLRQSFGDAAIRVANSHAKFAVLTGGAYDALLLTSMNLNSNPRIENFSLFCGGRLPAEYLQLVDDLFAIQAPGDGFETARAGRRDTARVLGSPEPVNQPETTIATSLNEWLDQGGG